MSTDYRPAAGSPCWIDLQTSDPAASRAFYTGLLGWEALAASEEFGGYFMFTRDGVPVAGCMPSDEQAPVRDVWSVYLRVDDAAKTLESVATHGGQVIVPPMPVATMGTMGFLVDPAGGAIGVWQADDFAGFTSLGEVGTPGWFELFARDYEGALAFYREVFGWQTRVLADTPEFRYTQALDAASDLPVAGVMDAATFLPEGVPSVWTVYLGVPDASAAAARVTELGGTVLREDPGTPYGDLLEVQDATGARLKLVAPNDQMPATRS